MSTGNDDVIKRAIAMREAKRQEFARASAEGINASVERAFAKTDPKFAALEGLFSDEIVRDLYSRTLDTGDFYTFRSRVLEVVEALSYEYSRRNRLGPDVAKRKAFEAVTKACGELIAALDALENNRDHELELQRALSKDQENLEAIWQWIEGRPEDRKDPRLTFHLNTGPQRVRIVRDLVQMLARSSESATPKYLKVGRPRSDVERDAIRALRGLWLELTGKRPRYWKKEQELPGASNSAHVVSGKFPELCKAVIDPVRGAHAIRKTSLRGLIEEVLGEPYGEPVGERPAHS